jgi:hypothetical protein
VVTLEEHLGVALEAAQIDPFNLRDRDVQIAAAQRRRPDHHIHVVGSEEHRRQPADGLGQAAGQAVESHRLTCMSRQALLPGQRKGLASATDHCHLQAQGPRLGLHVCHQATHGRPGHGVGLPADELDVAGGARRAHGGQHVDGLQEIALALRVGADDDRRPVRERQVEAGEVAIVG